MGRKEKLAFNHLTQVSKQWSRHYLFDNSFLDCQLCSLKFSNNNFDKSWHQLHSKRFQNIVATQRPRRTLEVLSFFVFKKLTFYFATCTDNNYKHNKGFATKDMPVLSKF